jgi:hypothetical protein
MLTFVFFMLFADLRKENVAFYYSEGIHRNFRDAFLFNKRHGDRCKRKYKRMTVYHVCIKPRCIKDMFIKLHKYVLRSA